MAASAIRSTLGSCLFKVVASMWRNEFGEGAGMHFNVAFEEQKLPSFRVVDHGARAPEGWPAIRWCNHSRINAWLFEALTQEARRHLEANGTARILCT
ncbi:MAG: hypothetical protein C0453_04190 [Comamonadaceae bacterium]|nr:hypothetical protein [Comamonadaceae bacterium]